MMWSCLDNTKIIKPQDKNLNLEIIMSKQDTATWIEKDKVVAQPVHLEKIHHNA